jgi:hypothetical protein
MTTTPKKIVVDCSTGEATEVELTAQEIADLETARAQAETEHQAREAAETAKATAKASAQTKLKALGLSDAEVSALLN